MPRTFVIDGTTICMPDTPANQAAWPQSRSQEEGCGFPIMRINSRRKADPRAAKLGKGDRLERWRKPNTRPKWVAACDYAKIPGSIAIRVVTAAVDSGAGFRTTEITLAATVLDPEEMSATVIGSLYLDRWKVELFIDDLKTTLGMAVLTSRSPAMVRRELLVHIIAYNLLRALMTCGKTVGCENPATKWWGSATGRDTKRAIRKSSPTALKLVPFGTDPVQTQFRPRSSKNAMRGTATVEA